jgi:hypothetical protein
MTEHEHDVLAAWEDCGCCAAVSVLGHGRDSDASAYRSAASWTKRGQTVDRMALAAWRQRTAEGLFCRDHRPDGPPWWTRNRKKANTGAKSGLGL